MSDKETNQPQKKLFDPETNTLRVSHHREARSNFLFAKLVLKKFGNLRLTSLGRASGNVVRVAQFLENNGFATITSMKSDVVEVSEYNSPTGVKTELEFVVEMKKGDKFDELTVDLK